VDDLLGYRDRFPILETCTYLINHSLAAMPAQAEDNLLDYARTWRERGIRSWGEGWWEMSWTVGDQIGRIVGAPPGSVVMHQNVTVAEMVVLSCFRQPGERNRIVYEEANFPSVRYLYQAQPELEVVACEDAAAIVDAIDERTLLVPISHVLFKNAEIQDVDPIIRRAHEVGAHVVLDCYQSAGVVPFDVTALGVDFATGGSVKWLCGGPGAGWLYVRPDLAERLEPTFVGWQGHARPFAFEPELEYAPGARRFLTGTPNVPALYAATAGYDVIEEVGVERIRERSLRLTRLLIDLCDEAGLEVGSPREPERRGGTVLVVTPDHAAVHAELGERGIVCDFRPDSGLEASAVKPPTSGREDPSAAGGRGGIRLGPHFFNTEEELRHTIEQLADIVASRAYERHAGAVGRF
jgi:kynureninase